MPVLEPSGFTAKVSTSDYTPQPRKSSAPTTAPIQTASVPTKILSVSAESEDHAALQRILSDPSIQISTCAPCTGL